MQASIIEALKLFGVMGAGFGILFLVAIRNGAALRRKLAEERQRAQRQEEINTAFRSGYEKTCECRCKRHP